MVGKKYEVDRVELWKEYKRWNGVIIFFGRRMVCCGLVLIGGWGCDDFRVVTKKGNKNCFGKEWSKVG